MRRPWLSSRQDSDDKDVLGRSMEPTKAEAPTLHTIAAVDAHFATGAESVTLTRAEWASIQEVSRGHFQERMRSARGDHGNGAHPSIERPLWRACNSILVTGIENFPPQYGRL